jgi:osmotically-inducible protein OsmY
MSIHVETNNGIVYLSGTADSKKQADNAIAIAQSVEGVKKVESSIKIAPQG